MLRRWHSAAPAENRLCANCTRSVHGVIYCESCLAARLEGVQPNVAPPVAGFVPASPTPVPGAGPNPALAGVLAGFFPFGVGAVYTGQYAKGLAHLVIFTLLVLGASSGSEAMGIAFGLGIAGFYFYQIIDSVRTARALQLGQAPPDPFGLGTTFSAGERVDVSKVPVGALVLIGLGVIFLLHTLDVWDFSAHRIWPLMLIGIGGWLLVRRLGLVGEVPPGFDRVQQLQAWLDGTSRPADAGISVPARQHGRDPVRPHPAPAAGGDRIGQDFPEYGWPRPARGTASVVGIGWGRSAAVIPGSEAGGEEWLAQCNRRRFSHNHCNPDSGAPWPARWS